MASPFVHEKIFMFAVLNRIDSFDIILFDICKTKLQFTNLDSLIRVLKLLSWHNVSTVSLIRLLERLLNRLPLRLSIILRPEFSSDILLVGKSEVVLFL